MPTLTPVLTHVAWPTHPWPVTDQDKGWLRVHPAMTPDEVGMALYSLACHTHVGDDKPTTVAAALDVLTSNEDLYAPGGLLLEAPGVTVEPGCCCDLFEWRDWLHALDGLPVDLGHEPAAPLVEYAGDVVRVWANEDSPAQGHVDLRRDQLYDLLRPVQRALLGFLDAVQGWAHALMPERAAELVNAVDRGLSISAPLLVIDAS